MARKGRSFELIISTLEKAVLPEGAKLLSPGFVTDTITGQPREVDILIEHKVGTFNVSVVIECRDRTPSQDVTWIEQIHTKTAHILANKVIVVSANGFTEPAIKKAKHFGIEARSCNEVSVDVISSWFRVKELNTTVNEVALVSVLVNVQDSHEKVQEFLSAKSTINEKIFELPRTGEMVTVKNIMDIYLRENGRDSLPKPEKDGFAVVTIVPHGEDFEKLNLVIEDKRIPVESLIFEYAFRDVHSKVKVSKVLEYRNAEANSTISQVIQFNGLPLPGGAGKGTLNFIRNEDGSLSVSIDPEKPSR